MSLDEEDKKMVFKILKDSMEKEMVVQYKR